MNYPQHTHNQTDLSKMTVFKCNAFNIHYV